MAVDVLLAAGTYAARTRSLLGPIAIARGLVTWRIVIGSADQKDPAQDFMFRFELSLDGGLTWPPNNRTTPIEIRRTGQTLAPNRGGTEAIECSLTGSFTDVSRDRQVRAFLGILGPDLTTTGITLTTA